MSEHVFEKGTVQPESGRDLRLNPSDVDFIPPLLHSLGTLMRLRGKRVSSRFLASGLGGSANISVASCLRAAERAGMKSRVVNRPEIERISKLTLPCVLLLENGNSAVLQGYDDQNASIILPESGEAACSMPIEELRRQYSGYAIFATFEERDDSRTDPVRMKQGHDWFWEVLKYYAPIYRHVLFASFVVNLISVATSLFVMNVYDRVIPNNAYETLWVLAVGVMLAFVFDWILRAMRTYFVDVAGRNADVVLSSRLISKVLTMRMDSRPESTGALVSNIREFETLREFFSSTLFISCIDVPFIVIFLALMFWIGGFLAFLPLICMVILLIVSFIIQSAARRNAEKSYRHNMQKNALLVEMVNGLESLKGAMAESRMQRLWEAVVGVSAEAAAESRRYNARAVQFATFMTQMTSVGMIVWGVYLIGAGEMSLGGLIGCNILVGRTMAPIMQLATMMTRLQNSRVSLKALNLLMDLPSENQEQNCMDFGDLKCEYALSRVSLTYPGQQVPSLRDISLRIRPGEKIGVIGKMGSGKSSLGKLLMGLYAPTEGQILFGGVDIGQLAVSDLRSHIGYMPQDVMLFYGSVLDNISFGDPMVNDHLVMRAAEIAGVMDIVRRSPAGFGTQVGEQGRNLSGGQRQAVGLARAVLHDPDILILDEPTGNMDTDSELGVQQRLMRAVQDKTLILITHRLSMLRIVDRLVVMDGGRIALDGPRDEVLKKLRERSAASRQKMGMQAVHREGMEQ
ncbi:MAG: type I secretion system permease/ATPase [Desulfovibrionaceae bacterium]|nr:type I secretion system permease/ATPase [Desulfovibrionaceae bacterium]